MILQACIVENYARSLRWCLFLKLASNGRHDISKLRPALSDKFSSQPDFSTEKDVEAQEGGK